MNKEDIAILTKNLTDIKDALREFEAAVRKNDGAKIGAAKAKILLIQGQIGRQLA